MRRWLRLLTYLGVACLTLGFGLVRLLPWARVLRGPASLADDLAGPWPWVLLTGVAVSGLVWLVADLGFGARRMPAWANTVVVGAAVIAVLLVVAERSAPVLGWSRLSDAPPKVQAMKALSLLARGLGDHHRVHGRFPEGAKTLQAMLIEEDGTPIFSPYLYGAARRRPLSLRLIRGVEAQVAVPEAVLPGTLLVVLSPGEEAYWVSAVVGEGIPVSARILSSESGTPVVVSNVPLGWKPP